MIIPLKKIVATFGYSVFAVVMAWVILFVSLSRMSLSVMASQNGCDSARKQLISYVMAADDSQTTQTYKLPTVSVLPTSPWYGLKSIRDYFWLTFSFNPISKSQISLFLADKKMAEMYEMIKLQDPARALQSAQDAVVILENSQTILDGASNQEEKTTVQRDVVRAGIAYRQMVESLSGMFDLDQTKYSVLLKDLDDWNQKESALIDQKTL